MFNTCPEVTVLIYFFPKWLISSVPMLSCVWRYLVMNLKIQKWSFFRKHWTMNQIPLTPFHNSTHYVEKPPTLPGSFSISHGATQHLSVSQTKKNSLNRTGRLVNTCHEWVQFCCTFWYLQSKTVLLVVLFRCSRKYSLTTKEERTNLLVFM